ncbi:MAG: DNA repair protein RadA, partial [Candidatus Omnitrophica bacterium]|nr:DNA repair protein RadA [Candidatus Omnitrophota bacterium]
MKTKTIYICQECGHNSVRWLGKCPSCSNWNTFVEETEQPPVKQKGHRPVYSDKPVML